MTLLFPVADKPELLRKLISCPNRNQLTEFSLPDIRVAWLIILMIIIYSSQFTFHNFLSYALGQIRMYYTTVLVITSYPYIQRFAKQNGINDVSTVIEAYEQDKPIRYYLFLEKTELLNTLREAKPIDFKY